MGGQEEGSGGCGAVLGVGISGSGPSAGGPGWLGGWGVSMHDSDHKFSFVKGFFLRRAGGLVAHLEM